MPVLLVTCSRRLANLKKRNKMPSLDLKDWGMIIQVNALLGCTQNLVQAIYSHFVHSILLLYIRLAAKPCQHDTGTPAEVPIPSTHSPQRVPPRGPAFVKPGNGGDSGVPAVPGRGVARPASPGWDAGSPCKYLPSHGASWQGGLV